MLVRKMLVGSGAALLSAGLTLAAQGTASASFAGNAGGGDGDLAWSAPCNANTYGAQLFSAAWNAAGEQCPGSGTPAYNTVTLGYNDYMPYFSADGTKLYFASQRSATSISSIYVISYPHTSSGAAGTDGATQLTSPSSGNDYAPTVNAAGTSIAFIRCPVANSCDIWTQSPIVGGTPVDSGVATLPPGSTSDGTANRPEFNPVNGSQIVFVAPNNHIELVTLNGSGTAASSPVDLSSETAVGTNQDEHPDWAPDGQALLFDSTRPVYNSANVQQNNGHAVFVMTNLSSATPTVAARWTTIPANTSQIEPVYAPSTTSDTSPKLAWVNEFQGSNIVDEGTGITSANAVTTNHANNIQVTWQPIVQQAQLPEAPLTIGLPVAGGALLFAGAFWGRRRRTAAA